MFNMTLTHKSKLRELSACQASHVMNIHELNRGRTLSIYPAFSNPTSHIEYGLQEDAKGSRLPLVSITEEYA
jgi:hypothetical protein